MNAILEQSKDLLMLRLVHKPFKVMIFRGTENG